jgi:2-polyprenyl-6-hydroxyphenyl methylase/3-demethylubiquinone-9 3-methyltransferase
MVVSTINRTAIAWLTAIVAAERILRWLPTGTHRYRKLVRPAEVTAGVGDGFRVLDRAGVRVNPLNRAFSFRRSLSVNYMMVLQRAAEGATA